jgi:hypothetical protein
VTILERIEYESELLRKEDERKEKRKELLRRLFSIPENKQIFEEAKSYGYDFEKEFMKW